MNVISPWQNCPFTAGKTYRVRKDFEALRDTFKEGELVVFERDAWSRYDGITGYFFHDLNGGGHGRIWDLYDDTDSRVWTEFFEELA